MLQEQVSTIVNNAVRPVDTLPTTPIPTSHDQEPVQQSSLRPALPNDFDGRHESGQAFLNMCKLYIQLVPHQFANEIIQIRWAFTFMKMGRTYSFADWTIQYE
ncbi:hypothetical protein BDZ94DRAFT_1352059 [Collybia nuda]|uniref:Uncharacterized protein n=1 Tax=Collybia nuda TaxID=64659 RepID=A0A9P5XUS8_9AGAR|nr:hypothetical protein BDZ94DRAFT_1352059 [Collybia nuda]